MTQNGSQADIEADVRKVTEDLANLVDQYVMIVTEGLCFLENENRRAMERPDISYRKVRVLKNMEMLDKMIAVFRSKIAPDAVMPSGQAELQGA